MRRFVSMFMAVICISLLSSCGHPAETEKVNDLPVTDDVSYRMAFLTSYLDASTYKLIYVVEMDASSVGFTAWHAIDSDGQELSVDCYAGYVTDSVVGDYEAMSDRNMYTLIVSTNYILSPDAVSFTAYYTGAFQSDTSMLDYEVNVNATVDDMSLRQWKIHGYTLIKLEEMYFLFDPANSHLDGGDTFEARGISLIPLGRSERAVQILEQGVNTAVLKSSVQANMGSDIVLTDQEHIYWKVSEDNLGDAYIVWFGIQVDDEEAMTLDERIRLGSLVFDSWPKFYDVVFQCR